MVAVSILKDEEMAFSPDNQKWIRDEIQDAIKDIKPPGGLKKALYVLREWSVLGACGTVFVALIIATLTQWNSANKRLADEATFEAHTDDRLKAIEGTLLQLRVSRASSTPNEKKSQSDAVQILATAKKSAIPLPTTEVEAAGKSFIGVSKENPEAWSVALDFVSYRTELNGNLLQVGTAQQIATTPVDSNVRARYVLDFDLHDLPTISVGGDVPADRAAQLYSLKSGHPDINLSRGKQVILIEGGSIRLDQAVMRHVIIRNTKILYGGTPVILEDVVFVNCQFVMTNEPAARTLALAVLTQSSVNFNPA